MKAPIVFVHDAFEIVAIRKFIFDILKGDTTFISFQRNLIKFCSCFSLLYVYYLT